MHTRGTEEDELFEAEQLKYASPDRCKSFTGRFDRLLYVGPPNEMDREKIFHIHLRKIPHDSDVSLNELARLTNGCTGADISLICREAAVAAFEVCLSA